MIKDRCLATWLIHNQLRIGMDILGQEPFEGGYVELIVSGGERETRQSVAVDEGP